MTSKVGEILVRASINLVLIAAMKRKAYLGLKLPFSCFCCKMVTSSVFSSNVSN